MRSKCECDCALDSPFWLHWVRLFRILCFFVVIKSSLLVLTEYTFEVNLREREWMAFVRNKMDEKVEPNPARKTAQKIKWFSRYKIISFNSSTTICIIKLGIAITTFGNPPFTLKKIGSCYIEVIARLQFSLIRPITHFNNVIKK